MKSFDLPDLFPVRKHPEERAYLKEQAKLTETGVLASEVAKSVLLPTPLSASTQPFVPAADAISRTGLLAARAKVPVETSNRRGWRQAIKATPDEMKALEDKLIPCPECGDIMHMGVIGDETAKINGKRRCTKCPNKWYVSNLALLEKHKAAIQKIPQKKLAKTIQGAKQKFMESNAKNGGYKKSRKKKRKTKKRKTRIKRKSRKSRKLRKRRKRRKSRRK